MKFSEYVVLGRQELTLDPLGFLAPYTALQDKLFKQFTVLSNQPACHGILALIYQCLQDDGIAPGQKGFTFEFRRAEIFWGILHALDTGTASVLNIRKYNDLMRDRADLSVDDIRKNDRVYASLTYGVLGHYSSPSTTWGILSKSGKQLTELGSELGAAFGKRDGKSLRKAIDAWRKGGKWDVGQLQALSSLFEAKAKPSADEAKVWRRLIEEYCERLPQSRTLWERPLSEKKLENWKKTPASYQDGFGELQTRYTSLSAELVLIQYFEQLLGLVQHIFEREYLSIAEQGNGPLSISELETQLVTQLGKVAAAYVQLPGHHDTKGLFQSLAKVGDYRDAAELICAHHVAHQRSKGNIPFIEDGSLRISKKFDFPTYEERCSALKKAGNANGRLAVIAHDYRRDWHFQRASLYHQYAHLA
ncbi:MAG: hypothetical protein WA191_14375 [Telluria sp.]